MSEPIKALPWDHEERALRTHPIWGWIAAISVVVLIAYILIAGWRPEESPSGLTALGSCKSIDKGPTVLLACGHSLYIYKKSN